MAQQPENKNQARGFSGLDSMVSDVSKDVEHAELQGQSSQSRSEAVAPQVSGKAATAPATPGSIAKGTGASSESSGIKWVLGAAAFIFVIWLIGNSSKQETPTYSPPPATVPAPSPELVLPPVPAPAPALFAAPRPSGVIGEKPPVGEAHVLDREQIHYCLSEKIRFDAISTIVNSYRSEEVEKFNGLIADYNSRCGHYRYRRGSLESVRAEVEAQRSEIERNAKRAWVRESVGIATPSNSRASTPTHIETEQGRSTVGNTPVSRDTGKLNSGVRQDPQNVIGPGGNDPLPGVTRDQTTSHDSGRDANRIPPNATLNVYGTGWVCQRGYRQVGNECQAVQLPPNAMLDVYGSGWVCQRGYHQVGNECRFVQLPLNATLDVYGSGWVCQRGYRQVGNECQAVQLPANATLDVYGSGWVCQRGYRQVGNECQAVRLPANAMLDVYGSGWICQRGYRQVGNECQAVQLPSNATLDVYGNGWVCQNGYRQVGNACQSLGLKQ